MKEPIVSFDVAKLAKEKGFNWPVHKHYELSLTRQEHPVDGTSGPFGWEKDELSVEDDYFVNNWEETDFSNKSWFHCAAPTQSFLQKWMRDVQKIHIEVSNWELKKWYYTLVDGRETPTLQIRNDKDEFEFESYEDTLEAGLKHALELI